ncbi:MAG: NfeD family protein [Thermoleophilaceae bacterium]|nr:NfeD family protein [Thermoleophilaceae bacterium]
MEDWIYWMIFAVVMAALELAVFSIFIFGPLAIAAVVTAIAASLGASIEIQLLIFIVLSLASGLALYPVARRSKENTPESATNVDALIGKEGRTLEEISEESLGLIRFDNSNWTARPVDGQPKIAANTPVKVVSIAGATAIVEPLEKTSTPDA